MLRLCAALRAASALRQPHLFHIDFSAKHMPGRLYFADRAAKSTSQEPNFVCLDNAMACQSADSNAAVLIRSGAPKDDELLQTGCMRFQGGGAAFVFRHHRLLFQGIGDAAVQTHEVSLHHDDIFALVSGMHRQEDIDAWVRAVETATVEGDVEYVAEEMLLQMRCVTEGCTSVVARVSKFSTGLPEPPCCSQAL
ncbi:hypothetical protein ABB37_03764 [Leptomonas pyrrhocoris]|uniref:Uncharacterized protein n=1 Tax=Leptomonas pyrrhocoris TaxID=157538 RepID=A0A0M9G344_LEPPY|nr:hypothetical protein ABB37_03764 [Leptomonas pyrrhocoris]KPA81385.1 hypothetical protein ABB37_03764 [Leptomonas pyrrhocoris]|eukprot:XP_015659824.1 hypothetical protein ABB37_03764 [Leptomonas pyrrhocoris]